jgi:hypothetical protein
VAQLVEHLHSKRKEIKPQYTSKKDGRRKIKSVLPESLSSWLTALFPHLSLLFTALLLHQDNPVSMQVALSFLVSYLLLIPWVNIYWSPNATVVLNFLLLMAPMTS